MVVKGDVVKKGDVLVRSDLLIKMEEVLKDVEFTHAEADILAKTFYDYTDEVSLNFQEKVPTGESKSSYALRLFNKEIVLFHPRIKYTSYDKIMNSDTLKIGKDFYLPLEWVKSTYKEYDIVNKKYTEEEAIDILRQHLDKYIRQLEEKGVQILENNVKIEKGNDVLRASGKIIVIEELGIDVPVNTTERRLEYEDEIIREDASDSQ